jgi:dipeptidyl aminopeptidase/acylaminoacyl peptidase
LVDSPPAGAEAPAALPPLIPREILFGNPERMSPQISPDGVYLTYIAPDKRDVLQVWLRTVGKQDDRVLTADPKRGIRAYFWTFLPGQLVYLQDTDGDENWHLFAVDIATGETRDLTPFAGVQAQLIALEPELPDQMLVALNKEDSHKHDIYRLDLRSGNLVLEAENPGNVVQWTADAQLRIRAATAATPDGGSELWLRPTTDAAWSVVQVWSPDDEGYAVGFDKEGAVLYLVGNHDANTQRLLALDIASGKQTVVVADDAYDVAGLFVHPVSRVIQAAAIYRARLEWQVLDPTVEADFARLLAARAGQLSLGDRDLADRTWLVSYTTDDGPVYYYAYDRPSGGLTFLFSHQTRLEGLPLAHLEPVSYRSRDGLTIRGYLMTPPGLPPHKLPTVLLVHGGPWGRDTWGFNPNAQWLANRGYAVLMVNFRGSAGYGKAFLNAGNREWGGKMHDDLIDGVNWLVEQGVADPARVAIMGGSYGGYATLAGLTFTPEVFRCGVDIVGPSNIITLIETIPPYWEPLRATFLRRVGDPEKEPDFLKSRSPLFFVDRIRAPLLIGQGANDPRVKRSESEQIVAAMRAAHRPVEYVVYTDEGHGFVRPENRLHFNATTEEFLAKHLGGRAEPAGEIAGHSGEFH